MGHHSRKHKKHCDKPKKCEKSVHCEKKCEDKSNHCEKKCHPCPKPTPKPLDCNVCKEEYDAQVKPILDVAIDAPFEPFLIGSGEDGTQPPFSGFDVDLIT